MDFFLSIFAFIILIGIIVTIHEGGHFLAALICNIKVVEFSIGFGPKIFSKNIKIKNDNILFTIRILPLGGFVKPLDRTSYSDKEWNDIPIDDQKRTFNNAPKLKKSIMVFGGPFANFVLAFFAFFIASVFVGNTGLPPTVGDIVKNSAFGKTNIKEGDVIEFIDGKKIYFASDAQTHIINAAFSNRILEIKTQNGNTHTVDFSNTAIKDIGEDMANEIGIYFKGKTGDITINEIMPNSPAEKAGFKVGDILTTINGESQNDLSKLLKTLKKINEESFTVGLKRGDEIINSTVTPNKTVSENGTKSVTMGVVVEVPNAPMKKIHLSFFEGMHQSSYKLITSTYTTVISIKKLIFGELSTKAISGPISIADYSGKSAKHGLYSYFLMIATISIAVGVFNLIPIPMLDGGHLLQYLIEGIVGKDFTINQLQKIQYFGIVAMTSIFIFAIFNDINRYFSFF